MLTINLYIILRGDMRNKKQKGYWLKKTESFTSGTEAKSRAKDLWAHEHIEHVQVDKAKGGYQVSFSIAKWYWEDMQRAGVKL